ncbi:related to trichodiene oxygenase cytochrome P450 [Ramularia collo-cygni]|uniref:Related to trichodiene oxygenase cytochrome P450 n=1 Tax=Ramularia collo-cygni TaxID=112498 RepID=A0A2D3V2U0_9PEZI|nr:related to trichodiene oxygenase cytochrome P450 [Ramularia collo-cygni]CZT23686.1 related to trichodiene oxygenase cytochrome P450 [Ramularia collo-cygni]
MASYASTILQPLDFEKVAWGVSISTIGVAFLVSGRSIVRNLVVDLLSAICDWYLQWKFIIRNENRTASMPSLPYRWPNGNGDVAKFLQGREKAEEWLAKYGSIYRIWSGSTSEVVISDPEHLKVVFKDSDQHLKAINNDSGYLMSQILGQCVGLLSGKAWQSLRSQMEVPFSHMAIANDAPIIRQQTIKFVDKLRKKGDFQHGIFDPARDLSFYPFLVVATLLYGELDDIDVQWLGKIAPNRQKLFTYVIKGGLGRFWLSKYLPTNANKLLGEFQQEWRAFNESMYKKAMAGGANAPMTALWEQSQRGEMSEVQLLQTLDESLFANLDVTTGAISWNFIYLASSLQDQTRLTEEVRREAGADETSWNAYIARSDTFLAACISESSRLRPVAPFSIPQAPPTDRKVGDWVVSGGTMVIVDTYGLNMRNPFWGNNSHQYMPERFLGIKASQLRYNMWRYGFGPRQCMGKYVADRMVRSIVALLIRDYQVELQPQDKGIDYSVNPDEWITHPDVRLICKERKVAA